MIQDLFIYILINLAFAKEKDKEELSLLGNIGRIILSIYLLTTGFSISIIGAKYPKYGLANFLSCITVWSFLADRYVPSKNDSGLIATGFFDFMLLICVLFGISLLTGLFKTNSLFFGVLTCVIVFIDGLINEILTSIGIDMKKELFFLIYLSVSIVIIMMFASIYMYFYITVFSLYGVGSVLIGLDLLFQLDWGYVEFSHKEKTQSIAFKSSRDLLLYLGLVAIAICVQTVLFIRKKATYD